MSYISFGFTFFWVYANFVLNKGFIGFWRLERNISCIWVFADIAAKLHKYTFNLINKLIKKYSPSHLYRLSPTTVKISNCCPSGVESSNRYCDKHFKSSTSCGRKGYTPKSRRSKYSNLRFPFPKSRLSKQKSHIITHSLSVKWTDVPFTLDLSYSILYDRRCLNLSRQKIRKRSFKHTKYGKLIDRVGMER